MGISTSKQPQKYQLRQQVEVIVASRNNAVQTIEVDRSAQVAIRNKESAVRKKNQRRLAAGLLGAENKKEQSNAKLVQASEAMTPFPSRSKNREDSNSIEVMVI